MATFSSSKPVSNIAVAFATQSAAVDTPSYQLLSSASGDKLAAGVKHHPGSMLLTPPNSISPTLPPHKTRRDSLSPSYPAPAQQVDSDIDLQDAVEHAAAQDQPTALSSAALSGLEAAGAITPTMLARHHLPDILLAHGPMAIRHVLGHLTHTVPGFSGIQPAKARRLVVSALESRAGGGPNGEVEFDKVGWGRWDARIRGQPPRDGRTVFQGSVPILSQSGGHRVGMSPPASMAESYAMSSMGAGLQIPKSGRSHREMNSSSWTNNSMLSSRDEDMEDMMMNMAEHEADKMSLDEADSDSSGAEDEVPVLEDDLDDATDEEDWAAIGPEALRKGSMPRNGQRATYRNSRYLPHSTTARIKSGSFAGPSSQQQYPRSLPHNSRYPQYRRPSAGRSISGSGLPVTSTVMTSSTFASVPQRIHNNNNQTSLDINGVMKGHDSQEREAVEALLKMGSM